MKEKQTYTFQEYLALEQQMQQRYEYYYGEVFAMAGGSLRHNKIIRNCLRILDPIAKRNGCEVFMEDVKLQIVNQRYYMYPDLMYTCHPEDIVAEYFVKHPSLLIEVLSDSTEAYDRSTKVERYFSIPSVQYYIIVAQKARYVGVHERQPNGWLYRSYQEEEVIRLENIDITFSLSDIYEDIRGLLPYDALTFGEWER